MTEAGTSGSFVSCLWGLHAAQGALLLRDVCTNGRALTPRVGGTGSTLATCTKHTPSNSPSSESTRPAATGKPSTTTTMTGIVKHANRCLHRPHPSTPMSSLSACVHVHVHVHVCVCVYDSLSLSLSLSLFLRMCVDLSLCLCLLSASVRLSQRTGRRGVAGVCVVFPCAC